MFRYLIAGTAIFAASIVMAPIASANLITIDDTEATDKYKQTDNSPCIFGHSCSNDGFPMTDIGSPDDSYDVYSPSYDVSEITLVAGGTTFIVAIDVNTAGPEGAPTWGADENLLLFEMCVGGADSAGGYDLSGTGTPGDGDADPGAAGDWCDGGVILASTDLGDGITLHDYKHGNGESDSLLLGFDLLLYNTLIVCGDGEDEQCVLTDATNVQFRAIVTNTSNGFETFFIVGVETPPIVPEPGILGLLGAGLLGIGIANRRRRKRAV